VYGFVQDFFPPRNGFLTEALMRGAIAFLACLFSPAILFADDIVFPDGTPAHMRGGLMLIRQGGQTTWSLGGVLFPRYVKVVTHTPDGKEMARFKFPSMLHTPSAIRLPDAAPAIIEIRMPDPHGNVYLDGQLLRSTGVARQLESPPMAPGKTQSVRLRVGYVTNNQFVIEDRDVLLRGGETTAVTFDGKGATTVPLTALR
jgi:uncharacterized protein (TIGR03000 family)